MVVLNSCLGAKGSGTDVFSSTASILVRRGVSAVVAMQYEISDRAAVEFARSLYEALADSMPVDAAVAEARKAVSLALNNTVEWGTPVLFMRSPDGALFRIDGMTTSAARASGTYQSMESPPQVAPGRVESVSGAPAATPPTARPELEHARPAAAAVRSVVPPSPTPSAGSSASPHAPEPSQRAASDASTISARAGGAAAGGNRRRLLIGGVVALVTLAVLYFSGVLGGKKHADGTESDTLTSQSDSTGDTTGTPAGGSGGAGDSASGDTANAAGPGSHQTGAPPPAESSEAVSDWERTDASVGGVQAQLADDGSVNVLLVVYYTGSRQEGQAVVDCTIRPNESVHRTLHFTVPLLHGRKGGTYGTQLRLAANWPAGSYPVVCETGGAEVYNGKVEWPEATEP